MKIRSVPIALCLGCILYLLLTTSTSQPTRQNAPSSAVVSEAAPVATPRDLRSAPLYLPIVTLSKRGSSEAAAHETTTLQLAKAGSAALIIAGEFLTYTITVTNTGTAIARDLVIYDELPVGMRFAGISSLSVAGGVNPQLVVDQKRLTGTVSSLQPTGKVQIIGRTIVETNASGTALQNTVYLTATNASLVNQQASIVVELITATPTAIPTTAPTAMPSPTRTPPPLPLVTATATATALPNLADLQIHKAVAPVSIQAGAFLTYTIRVDNLGPGVARNVLIRDTLPQGLRFDGPSSLSVRNGENPQLLLSSTQLTGTVDALMVGGAITVTAPALVLSTTAAQFLLNTVTVAATTPDQQLTNNSTVTSVTVFKATGAEQKSFLPLIHD